MHHRLITIPLLPPNVHRILFPFLSPIRVVILQVRSQSSIKNQIPPFCGSESKTLLQKLEAPPPSSKCNICTSSFLKFNKRFKAQHHTAYTVWWEIKKDKAKGETPFHSTSSAFCAFKSPTSSQNSRKENSLGKKVKWGLCDLDPTIAGSTIEKK